VCRASTIRALALPSICDRVRTEAPDAYVGRPGTAPAPRVGSSQCGRTTAGRKLPTKVSPAALPVAEHSSRAGAVTGVDASSSHGAAEHAGLGCSPALIIRRACRRLRLSLGLRGNGVLGAPFVAPDPHRGSDGLEIRAEPGAQRGRSHVDAALLSPKKQTRRPIPLPCPPRVDIEMPEFGVERVA
jgi:hypothetical protein